MMRQTSVQFGLMNLGEFDRAALRAGTRGVTLRDNITGETFQANYTLKAELHDMAAPYPVRFMYNDREPLDLPDDVMAWTPEQMRDSTDWFNNHKWVSGFYNTRFVPDTADKWLELSNKLRRERYDLGKGERKALQHAIDDCIEVPQLDLIG